MSNEEIILNNIKKIEKYPELKNAILDLINEKNELLDFIKIDHLTGAYNRRVLDNIRKYSVVVMCDIDGFKKINDTYGHKSGDIVLKNVTRVFLKNTRLSDIVCRYGGDEFLLIFDNCSKKIVVERMKQIKREISKCVDFEKITISIGISKHRKGTTLFDTINEADIALYTSKNNGKNKITIYNKKLFNE